jgi:hypothetical protein
MFKFDNRAKDINKLEETDLKKDVEKMCITLKMSKNEIFIQVVVEGFLFDGTIHDLLWNVGFRNYVAYFIF